MKRRTFLQGSSVIPVLPFFSFSLSTIAVANSIKQTVIEPLNKPHKAWRGLVSTEAYKVLFEENTEEPGSSELNYEYREGIFICAACYLPLFESQYKYESGSGWPSFTQPIPGSFGTKRDFQLIFLRTEYHCARCGGHQGHVFKDGPPPRGERWCNNGLALKFVPKTDQLPALRG
ncbi:MAG: peptide-methionine (R)-S-oxide reductase MsrB [Nitrosomonas sp.]|jgi:peptide-methionine (R)-S-oxide reductase|uniref:peptide-methionine (R)-S-oxide reductase MsrB n=1 Tax=Nitrosomonas sp. TaxID=42353 RepID=UPI00271EB78A|nr:peptide-methionine (R)-S-oxide reductase MsrB [Nitrosomonas sp.]MDO8893377.1 peptide-methionine (R)-S-oxide reductase MsrB [Nitrosomonas sp.]MDP3663515.1 peptide-methionine (R)-S-oxide reductase MsrB [Nitrosomonas sp.]MDZ4104796.1 peptide-methionine (R)-S-oxide reductase MsrB [Nitrosomonas sp.]